MESIPLAGEIVRVGDTVRRPWGDNADFVHLVLGHLECKGNGFAPRYQGKDPQGREVLEYLLGDCPQDLGAFSDTQCAQAAKIIRRLHQDLQDFEGCGDGRTVCHNDLSPCNFVFRKKRPVVVIDWDAAGIGDPADDLAYAVWMWLDIGNQDNEPDTVAMRVRRMVDAYGLPAARRAEFLDTMARQMRRVAGGRYPTPRQAAATWRWANDCLRWLLEHRETLRAAL